MPLPFSRYQPMDMIPAGLRSVRVAMFRDAPDHTDLDAYQTAITEASALVVRLRQIAATCERAQPLLEFAEQIEDAAFPLEREAMEWDDARDGRVAGNRLDNSRVWQPRDLGGV